MSREPKPLACACKTPKPVTVTEDHFGGLFTDEPMYSVQYTYCDRCSHTIHD